MTEEQKEERKKEAVKKEAKRFSFVGVIATAVDYTILNIASLVFQLPILVANVISTTTGSLLSYSLNKNIVFEDRRHSRKRTITYYVLVIIVSIYVIQSIVIYLVGHRFDAPTIAALKGLEQIGLPRISEAFVSTNLAKICASMVAAIWNYVMLRKFVFIPESHVIDRTAKQRA